VFKSFFAQLIAGPIVRARDFLPQLAQRVRFDASRLHHGVFLFVAGLGLKLGVADVLRQFADDGFSRAGHLATSDAWLDLYAYAFQIFADFWGYSTMARGIGEMFALELPINFDLPFSTRSIQEYWQHWHMTLTAFFTTYLYTPLARAWQPFTLVRSMVTTVFVMTVSGLWHGAGWTFILWGLLHGMWLAVEALYRRLQAQRRRRAGRPKVENGWALPTLQQLLVFHGVCLLWVLFRSPSMSSAVAYWRSLLWPPYGLHSDVSETLVIYLIGFGILQGPLSRAMERESFLARPVWAQVTQTWVLLAITLGYAQQQYDFIYFAF
jgi:D-alanyl-lipoteichoic acid acyltransferase DltB (MBOAT superfamily)